MDKETLHKRRYTKGLSTWKKCSTSLVVGAMQIKTTMRYTRMTRIKKTDNPKYWKKCGTTGTLVFLSGGDEKWYSYFGIQFGSFVRNILLPCNPVIQLLDIYEEK